jgi:hypothetical protein
MEADPQNASTLPGSDFFPDAELSPLSLIRTETILSKFPVHNLAKKGRVDIQIMKAGAKGDIELKWEVSYSERYGQARQLAYKLDTIVVDQRIDETGRPLPERICLGSLNQIAQDLGIAADHGTTSKNLKRAFRQNALAGITAKFRYKGNDGTERTLEATFTRYSVIFTGEKLSDGRRADAVYIELNPTYREVLNNAPVRPLNFEYKKQLSPAAQRFYEIVSYKIFAALKYNQPMARLPYSEYCTFSAQQRYLDYDHFKKQMYKIHRPHLASGYITKVNYSEMTDDHGQADWIMSYLPGPKARVEYAAFTGKRVRAVDTEVVSLSMPTEESVPSDQAVNQRRLRQGRLNLQQRRLDLVPPAEAEQPTASGAVIMDGRVIDELGKRGVGETDARLILAGLPPGQPVLDQLEYGDYLITRKRGKIANPTGFYISLLQRNVPVPSSFETSQARKARQEAESAKRQAIQEQQAADLAAEEAERQKLEDQIAALPEPSRQALFQQAKAQLLASHPGMALFFRANPDNAINDGAVRARMRQFLAQGWKASTTTPPT